MSQPQAETDHDGSRPVLVGVDGSESSIRALRWAARQAGFMGAALEVVTVWTFPEHTRRRSASCRTCPGLKNCLSSPRMSSTSSLTESCPNEIRIGFTPTSSGAALRRCCWRQPKMLTSWSLEVEGEGHFAELLLGSVSERCMRHAKCPVVVVP